MSLKKRAADFMYCILMGSLYCYGLASHIFASTILDLPESKLLLFCAASVLFFYIAFFNKITVIVFAVLSAASGAIVYYALKTGDFGQAWIAPARKDIEGLVMLFLGRGSDKPEYSLVFGVLMCAVLGFFAMLNLRARFGFYLLTLFAVEIIALPIYMDWGKSEQGILVMCFCFLAMLVKKLNLFTQSRKNGGDGVNPGFALFAIPFCAAVFIGAYFLPKPEIDVDTARARESIGNAAGDMMNAISAPSRTSSFDSNGGRLGGPITLSGGTVMDVRAKEPLYLSGSVCDVYTGYSWAVSADAQTALQKDESGAYPTNAYSSALSKAQGYYMRYYGRYTDSVSITVRDIKTRTIYTPPFDQSLETDAGLLVKRSDMGVVTANKALREGERYTQEYISWDYQNAYFINILQSLAAQNMDGDLPDDERERYLQLPGGLPERVKELALFITGDFANDYDKLKALEMYLASYPYTLSPGNVPAGRDFVDYFLFEEKQGYCVYYASALAVMARCAGIPIRYVEGYIMPEESKNGIYAVTGKQAHAWVEAFFKGFGWVRFEATAPYYAVENGGEAPSARQQPISESEFTPGRESLAEESAETPRENEAVGGHDFTGENGAETEKTPSLGGKGIFWGIPVLIAVLAALAAALILINKMRARKLAFMKNRGAVETYFRLALGAAGVCGYPIRPSETANAYAVRLGGALDGDSGASLETAADVFSKALYSQNEITDSEKNTVIRCYAHLLAKLRASRLGGARYIVNRYILMRI